HGDDAIRRYTEFGASVQHEVPGIGAAASNEELVGPLAREADARYVRAERGNPTHVQEYGVAYGLRGRALHGRAVRRAPWRPLGRPLGRELGRASATEPSHAARGGYVGSIACRVSTTEPTFLDDSDIVAGPWLPPPMITTEWDCLGCGPRQACLQPS